MTTPDPDPDDAEALSRRLTNELIDRTGYACPTCLPALAVSVKLSDWTVTIAHRAGCETFATWLLHGHGTPTPPINPKDPR